MKIFRKPFFSVVIPTYNRAELLERAIISVLNQSFQDFEIIIIDNNSTDNTLDVVEAFRDPRIRLYKIDNRGIIAISRNLGMSKARGEWIALLDSDDLWYSSRLETLVDSIQCDDACDVISTDEVKVCSNSNSASGLIYGGITKLSYKSLLLDGNRLSPSATVIRRQFLETHAIKFTEDIGVNTIEDYELWLNLAFCGARYRFIHSFEGIFFVHDDNESNSNLQKTKSHKLIRDHVLNRQSFDPNKQVLLDKVDSLFKFRELINRLSNHKNSTIFFELFKIFIRYPFLVSSFLFKKLSLNIYKSLVFHFSSTRGRVETYNQNSQISDIHR